MFNRLVPAALAAVASAALTGGIYGGVTSNELPQALSVMIPLFLIAIAAAYGMFRGAAFGWHLWTVILGLWLIGGVAALFAAEPFGLVSGGVLFWSSVVSIAIMWRTQRIETWKRTATIYAGINGISFIVALVRAQAPAEAATGVALAAVVVGQIVWTYSVPVRWWSSVGLGWTGPQIGDASPGRMDAHQQAAEPDVRV